jgi:cell division GTPase FtsZ
MSDDLDFNITPPPAKPTKMRFEDEFSFNVAFNMAFVGVGQAGGRIAETFRKMGYVRACAVNTTVADLAELKMPDAQKLDLGDARGAGKDPSAAAALFAERGEDLFDLYKRSWGEDMDYAMVCFAAAGGTGAGGHQKAIEVARTYMQHCKRPPKVGAIIALPKTDEGQRFAKNTLYTAKGLINAGLSPVIFIDNQKIRVLYDPKLSQQHDIENGTSAQIFHMFNRLAGTDSEHTTFDRADFAKLMDSGVITFAADSLEEYSSPAQISTAIRERLQRNILATVDFSASTVAALLYVLDGNSYDDVKSSDLDHGTAMFTRILADDSTVFPGVYPGNRSSDDAIKVLAMIGALPWPQERFQELADKAGLRDDISKILGV